MSKKEISFTEGPVFQSLLRFAIPVLGALILQLWKYWRTLFFRLMAFPT